jgi:hypothetical protein
MRRVLAFVQKPVGRSPGQRFRLEQWAPYLRSQHGIQLDFCAFESDELSAALDTPANVVRKATFMLRDFWRRREHVRLARDYDAAVVFREASLLGPALYERVLSRSGVPYILDFDDAIWMANPPGAGKNGVFARLKFPEKTATIARLAGAVTVGNEFLASWARHHNPNVHVVPTSIELAKYSVQPELAADASDRHRAVRQDASHRARRHLRSPPRTSHRGRADEVRPLARGQGGGAHRHDARRRDAADR